MTGQEFIEILENGNYSKSISFNYFYDGQNPVDLFSVPFNTVDDIMAIPRAYRYKGMTVTVLSGSTLNEDGKPIPEEYWLVGGIKDENWEKKPYLTTIDETRNLSAQTYSEANSIATNENIGSIINVINSETISGDTYSSGLYVVIGAGSVSKLGITSATGDVEGDVENLKSRVLALETTVNELSESCYWIDGDSE